MLKFNIIAVLDVLGLCVSYRVTSRFNYIDNGRCDTRIPTYLSHLFTSIIKASEH